MNSLNDFLPSKSIDQIDENRVAPMVAIRSILLDSDLTEIDKTKINEEVLLVKKLAEMQKEKELSRITKVAEYFEGRTRVLNRRLWIVLSLEAITIISFSIILL